jgi:hypothetical protein
MNERWLPPLFVLGNPRSGTTLLRLMLTCHPRIAIPPECGFAVWLLPRFDSWTRSHTDDPRAVADFVAAVVATRKFETWALSDSDLTLAIRRRKPATYAELVDAVYGAWLERHDRTGCRWGDKNNFYLHHVAEIRTLFPDAILVHIVRDGRDVACSYLELGARALDVPYSPRLPSELDAIAREWSDNVTVLDEALARLGGTTVTIRYEDLVRDPADTLGTVLATFGERFHPDMLSYPERNASEQLEPAAFLQWKARTLHGPDDERIGRHRRDLTPSQIQQLERGMWPVLVRHGYVAEAP